MLRISNDGIITLSRGDNCEMPLFINAGTELEPLRYDLNKNNKTIIYFSLMQPNQYFENGCLRRMYSAENSLKNKNNKLLHINANGDLVIYFEPKDTMYLMPGKYFYEIKADLTGDGYINTIIQKTEFYIQ